jgi:hypothetical protein
MAGHQRPEEAQGSRIADIQRCSSRCLDRRPQAGHPAHCRDAGSALSEIIFLFRGVEGRLAVDGVALAVMPEHYLRVGIVKTEVLVSGQERGLAPVAGKTSGGRGVSLRRSAKEMWDLPSRWS